MGSMGENEKKIDENTFFEAATTNEIFNLFFDFFGSDFFLSVGPKPLHKPVNRVFLNKLG